MTKNKRGFDSERHLRARWSKGEQDIMYDYPRSCDGHFLHYIFGCERYERDPVTGGGEYKPSFLKELDKRGYDITTLRFLIRKKEDQS